MLNLLPGTEVKARSLKWEVVTTQQLGQQILYRLRCLEGALLGKELDILHPFEKISPVRRDFLPDKASPLLNWLVYHQAFLLEQALGDRGLLAVQPGRLRLEPYQLVPVLRAIRMSRVRLGLFDGVGLGKTIQAGLVITELMARRLTHRILIVCPAGPLLQQWKIEMSERFGLRLEIINRARLEEIRRSTELGANPFDHTPLGLASIDFLKQEKILSLLERASYDLIIIDEAHHCMDLGALSDRADSQRRRLAEVLARQCDALLLLTATPHDGSDRSFASLCKLLDPSLTDGRGNLRENRYKHHVVRRLKQHIIDPVTKKSKFQQRQVNPCGVNLNPQEHPVFANLQQNLLQLIAPQLKQAFRAKRYSDVLAFIALLKRSVSTAEACRATLLVVAQRFQELLTQKAEEQESRRQRLKTIKDYQRKLERFGTVSVEEEEEQTLLVSEEIAQQFAQLQQDIRSANPNITRMANIVEALDELISLAGEATEEDPKLTQLISQIKAIRSLEPNANILVYTEYIDSQKAAVSALKKAKIGKVLEMSGADSDRSRHEITESFRQQDNLVLVSTDTAAEGLNLHQRCHHLIHLELPFSINRIEQRNGRIDRFGQNLTPFIYYFYLKGTFEERILLRLLAKYERQRSQLTFVPNTLGITSDADVGAEKLLKGLMDEDEKLFKSDTPLFTTFTEQQGIDFHCFDEHEGTDAATQELLAEIDKSLKGFQLATQTHNWLAQSGLNAENKLLNEAEDLQKQGAQLSGVDLVKFVQDAIWLDGGNIQESGEPDIFNLQLPATWNYGLDEMPGYNRSSHLLRVTTNLEITRDGQGNTVGYLGRAHPLVRRALDRVRNLSFGRESGQDIRVSAVKGDVKEPTLLLTYLGRINSKSGRELEQVIAVKINSQKRKFYGTAEQWLTYCDRQSAIGTKEVWKTYFQPQWEHQLKQAQQEAESGFKPIATAFIEQFKKRLDAEGFQLKQWLETRGAEIISVSVNSTKQLELFGNNEPNDIPEWADLNDPVEQLTAFATDKTQCSKTRSEAEGVLRIYAQRCGELDARTSLKDPAVIPLGILMIIPQ